MFWLMRISSTWWLKLIHIIFTRIIIIRMTLYANGLIHMIIQANEVHLCRQSSEWKAIRMRCQANEVHSDDKSSKWSTFAWYLRRIGPFAWAVDGEYKYSCWLTCWLTLSNPHSHDLLSRPKISLLESTLYHFLDLHCWSNCTKLRK